MALVQSVNGFGWATDRSVTRPYGYGRGMMSVDPAYGPYMSGRYAPVRVTYARETVRTADGFVDPYAWVGEGEGFTPVTQRQGTRPTAQDSARARKLTQEALTHGGTVPLPGSPREYKGPSLVPQPEAGGKQPKPGTVGSGTGVYKTKEQWQELLDRQGGAGAKTGTTAAAAARVTGRAVANRQPGRPANEPTGFYRTQAENWLVDASRMESIRNLAVDQYVTKNNEWAPGKGVPLGIPGESKYKGISKADALASMMQVVARDVPWQQKPKPKTYSGQYFADKYKPGTQYKAYAPAFTIQSANNAYYDMGLWRNTPQMTGEVTNWKRTFDALGLYAEGARPNLNSTGWGYYESAAMAEFMKIANSNPQAYQSVADLPKLRQELLSMASQANAKNGGAGAGGRSYPFTQTNTSTNVQISNLEDARETLRGQITNMIGRFPTDAEVKQFLGKLNDYERGHPSKTTTTTTYSSEDTSTTSSTGPRGDEIDPFNLVQGFAQNQVGGDYHAYQQLRYYQAISDIMGSPMNTQSIPQEK